MRTTTSTYKQIIASGETREFLVKINMTLADDTQLEFTNADIMQGSFKLESASSGDSTFDLGAAVIGKCEFTLRNFDDTYTEYDFFNATAVVWLKLVGDSEYHRIGFYTIDEPEFAGSLVKLTLLDNMWKFDRELPNLTFPITIGSAISSICTHCGVTLATASYHGSTFTLTKQPSQETNCREFLQYCAMIGCNFCVIDSQGQLNIKWYGTLPTAEDDLDGGTFSTNTTPYSDGDSADGGNFTDYSSGDSYDGGSFLEDDAVYFTRLTKRNISTDELTITGVKFTINNVDYSIGTSGYVLVLDNPLVDESNVNAVLNLIWDVLEGFKIRGYEVTALPDLTPEVGDPVAVSYKGNMIYSYLTNFTFTPSACTASLGCESPARSLTRRYSKSVQTAVEVARRQTDEIISDYDLAVQVMNAIAVNAIGGYENYEDLSTGGRVWYLSNAPITKTDNVCSFETGSTVFKRTGEGLFVSTDGGQTFVNGYDAQTGQLVVNVLNAIGVNAEWVKTGTLTVGGSGTNAIIVVKDASNNTIATINTSGVTIYKGRIESANGYWFLDATTGEARLTSAFDYLETTANYSGAYVPLYNNSPASGWDSDTRKANIGNTFLNTSTGKCYQWQPYVNFQFHSGSHIDGTDTITFYYRDKDGQLWASESLRTANSIANKAYEIPIPSKDFWLRIVKNTGTTSSFGFAYTNLYSLPVTTIGWSKVTALPTVEDLYEVTSFPSYQGVSTVSSDRMWHITPSSTTYAWVEVGDTLKDAIKRIGSESFVTASHEEIFNKLTNNGAVQGLYSYNGAIYLGGQYIGAGEIAIGGSQYSDNPSLKIKDTNDDVVGTWTKEGIMANKGTFGILHIDAGSAPTYEDAKIYAEGVETFFQLNAATLSRSITKNIYFNPSEEGWTGEYIQIYMDFGSLNTGVGHDTTVCFNVHLYKLQSGSWTQLESRSFNFAGTELDGKSQFFDTEFDGSDDTDYKISIYVYKHNWQEDYYGVVNTTTFESFNIGKNGIKGDLIGNIKGRADLTGLSIGRYNDIEYNKETGYLEVHTELLVGEVTENVTVSSTDIEKLSGGTTIYVKWDTGSDRRLKHDINPLDVELCKQLIDSLEPVEFAYNYEAQGKHYGMIAQDVRKVLDNLGEKDALLEKGSGGSNIIRTINYEELIAPLINYVKRQQAEIDELRIMLKEVKDGYKG